jgi:hypothetical protein
MRTPLILEFRVLFVAILAVIVPFGLLLYVLPSATPTYWAWNIGNTRSAILIGCAYVGATVYYVLALRENDWLQVRYGLGGLIVFSLVLLGATALHWNASRPTIRRRSSGWASITRARSSYRSSPAYRPNVCRAVRTRAHRSGPRGEDGSSRAIFYPVLTLLVFVFAIQIGAWWPWKIEVLDLQVFCAQIAIIGWTGIVALRGGLSWRGHRLFLVLVGAIGVL